jgi:hypothetical protein
MRYPTLKLSEKDVPVGKAIKGAKDSVLHGAGSAVHAIGDVIEHPDTLVKEARSALATGIRWLSDSVEPDKRKRRRRKK